MSFHSPQQRFWRFYRPSCLVEKRTSVAVSQTGQPLPSSCSPPQSIPHPPPVNHPPLDKPPPRGFYTRPAWQKTALCVCVCVLYAGGWRVPEWLSPQIVKEAHGKFTAWAKPQAFSIISADFSFFVPFKKVIIADCTFFGFILPTLSWAFWAFLTIAALCF